MRMISAVGHGKLLCKEIGNQVRGDMVQILLHAFTETTCMYDLAVEDIYMYM